MELSDAFFQKAAGWQTVQHARALLASGQVLSSNWTPPTLRGVVQAGERSYRAGLIIRSALDIDNLCTCREARDLGILCAHSVAVGLRHVRQTNPEASLSGTSDRARIASRTDPQPQRTPTPKPGRSQSAASIRRAESEASAPLLEIQIVLPPNIEEAIARGRILCVIEGLSRNQRAPLSAFAKSGVYRLDPSDAKLLDAIESVTGGESPGMLQLGLDDFGRFLSALQGHPRVTCGRNQIVEVATTPESPALKARLLPDGRIELTPESGSVGGTRFSCGNQDWLLQQPTRNLKAAPVRLVPSALTEELQGLWQGPQVVERSRIPTFLSLTWPRLLASGNVQADFSLNSFEQVTAVPRFTVELSGGLAQLQATLIAGYGIRAIPLGVSGGKEDAWLPDPDHPTRYGARNSAAERAALAQLQQAGFNGPNHLGQWQLMGQERVLRFFTRDYSRWMRQWTVTLEARLERSAQKTFAPVKPGIQIQTQSSGVAWFDMEITYTGTNGEVIPSADIQQLLRGGSRRLKDGRLLILDTGAVEELEETLRDCTPKQMPGRTGARYRMNSEQAAFLNESLEAQGFEVSAPAIWHSRTRQMSGAIDWTCPPLGRLESVLRPYQKKGVAWLQFLRENRFGGVLADEMGLGKTLQVLAHLQASRNAPSKKTDPNAFRPLPNLVICPSSLVFNWVAEAARFTPDLRVLSLEGSDRHTRFSEIPEHDLVITSYALIRRDLDSLQEFEFDTILLDEAQHIKNRSTRNAQSVKALRGAHRLVLTGTPLENSVLDLWSLFDFLMPGYLGSADDFRQRYEQPIVREKDTATMERLARRVRPFLLRRTKKEVLKDLPPKLEQVSYCELSRDQATVYGQLLEATRKEVLEHVGAQGLNRSRMLVLTALLRLRQVCCDLRLLTSAEDLESQNGTTGAAPDSQASGKVALFLELLDEVLDGGHRALVFSQFTSMLGLLRQELESRNVPYCYLDGSTRDRKAVVEQFQGDASIPVFLISLKAGGVGLNLTGADTVIHFDPWWNPAVEDQATDRAHRLGQTRQVTNYKLITRNTVEEKILLLQRRKREWIESTLTGEEALTQSLSWEEIQELLG